jgi:hypothetical protein
MLKLNTLPSVLSRSHKTELSYTSIAIASFGLLHCHHQSQRAQ